MAEGGNGTRAVAAAVGDGGATVPERFTLEGDLAEVQQAFLDRGWTDGLPIVPPTEDAVEAMLAGGSESGETVVGELAPLGQPVSVAHVAANAVMAGCRPEYFRTVLAAVRAMLIPEFNLYTIQTTTHPVAPLVVVHGPEARRIDLNGKTGLFGPGFQPNATIGRAIRLVMMNLGGGRPGVRDFATQGTSAKFSYCITENVDDSPWPEFHTTRGFAADESAVTVVGVEGPQGVNDHESTDAPRNLDIVADVLGHLGGNNWYASDKASDVVVVLSPEHAGMAGEAGWSRQDVQRYLHHRVRRPVSDLSRGGQWDLRTWSPWMHALGRDETTMVPIVESPDNIIVLVAGGPGKFSSVMVSMGNICRAVTAPIPA